jgi:hypothetical protein
VWATYVLKFGSRGWSWRHWVPLLFLLSLVGPLAVSRFYPVLLRLTLSIAGLYLTTSLAVSVRIALREHSWKAASMLPLVFGVRHLAHGLGSLLGLFLAVVPGMRWKGRRSMRG